jgi:BolA protein
MDMDPSTRARRIESILRSELDAIHLAHPAAPAAPASGAGHYAVLIVSPRFEGLGRVAAQRLVYDALGDLIKTEIHALQLRTLTPSDWSRLTQSDTAAS